MTLEETVAQLESQRHLPSSFAIGPMKSPALVEAKHDFFVTDTLCLLENECLLLPQSF